ncbi:acetate/propionate family kinase [Sedimenticola hydrogenitrophicus]|uniref:acetate/propionate family kinase n=1 Tax=Sedimenticola hydrogenitrophicus TaxID=2967975 RepID=UPI0021A519FF
MSILVINAGSSSIKYQLFDMQRQPALASGLLERIGEPRSRHQLQWLDATGQHQTYEFACQTASHHQALEQVVEQLGARGVLTSLDQLDAIGHRVVHGGERFSQPVLIDSAVIDAIRDMIPLAPLHNPANLEGIEVTLALCPSVPQVAVFDTAFHQTMPAHAYHYALPERLYRNYRVRRYGFHGTSHHFVAKQAAEYLEQPLESLNLITLHLGNGCSASAIQAGHCIDTSMGMTPLEGLMMGTRCGDIDPALHFYLLRESSMTAQQLERLLNRESGLKGVCGSSDMREVADKAARGDAQAQLARAMFAYRVKKSIGSYYAALGRVDAILFTGGIGEHDGALRRQICGGLEGLGIEVAVEDQATTGNTLPLHTADSRVKLLVVPTNEELEIARCAQLVIDSKK